MRSVSLSVSSIRKHSRSPNVLEVDAAHRRLQHLAEADDLVRILRADLDVEDVDPGEPLEQDALALHDRLGRERADVPQPQNRCPVGDHGHQVASCRVAEGVLRIVVDGHAGFRHSRTVCEGQIPLGRDRLRGDHLDLPGAPPGVIFQRITRKCRQVGVSSVFASPRETGVLPIQTGV